MMIRVGLFLFVVVFMTSCGPKEVVPSKPFIDVQGHRGCRGLMPENTLPAFQKALELGVNTLEMDLVISADERVVVSHEPFFRAGIALTPDGDTIGPGTHEKYNMFKMPYAEIQKYTLGTVPDKNHPNRKDIKTYKPLFQRVVQKTQDFVQTTGKPMPKLNIEIKRHPEYDGIFHPPVDRYVDLVLAQVKNLGIEEDVIIQSFDLETLRLTKTKNPKLPIALLIENKKSVKENIEALGFKPNIYSCYHKLLNQAEVDYCKSINVKVIPWTVNSQEDIDSMVDLGVNGIISDYPDRVIATVR